MNIKDRKTALTILVQQKRAFLNEIENRRQVLITEIVHMEGKLELLAELEKEETPTPETNETIDKTNPTS